MPPSPNRRRRPNAAAAQTAAQIRIAAAFRAHLARARVVRMRQHHH